ncbi:MAG: carboxypeptidase regulatory-like domain-containing protein [Candidatus Brocadiaceae bacterium]|nr:carboxypeptidase regulatory-like domain-containing protein [Candidatus Brocadiaceae bacterium]
MKDGRQQTVNSYQQSAVSRRSASGGAGSCFPCLLSTVYCLPAKGGFALISVIIILSLLGIATGVATSFAHRLKTSRRQVATEDELKALKEAILGNPRQYSKEGRSNFGYLGDMGLSGTGQLPALAGLYTKGSQPTYALGTAGQGAGWAGPYITPILREDLADLLKDPYGNTYSYTTTAYQRASDNEWVSARIRSFGPNKTDDNGTGDDRQIEILQKETRSTVSGYVKRTDGTAISGATVTLYYPVAGSVSNLSTTTNASGLYQFPANAVPFGVRTITVSAPTTGSLEFAEGSALSTDTGNEDLSFNITNRGTTDVIVNAIRLDYTIPPPDNNAYFQEVYVGGTQVFDYSNDALNDALNDTTNPRGPTGTTITFADTSIAGSGGGSVSTTKRVLVAADSAQLPNVILSTQSGGGTLNIRYINFYKNQAGGGPKVSINDDDGDGQPSFTVTLYNGATVVLTQSFIALEQP